MQLNSPHNSITTFACENKGTCKWQAEHSFHFQRLKQLIRPFDREECLGHTDSPTSKPPSSFSPLLWIMVSPISCREKARLVRVLRDFSHGGRGGKILLLVGRERMPSCIFMAKACHFWKWAYFGYLSQSDTYVFSGLWLGVDLRKDTQKYMYLKFLDCED